MNKKVIRELFFDALTSIVAGLIVAFGLHVFANSNNFAPGGISGIASVIATLTHVNMGYYMIMFNLPLFILASIYVERKLGIFLTLYVATQSATLILLEKADFIAPYVASSGNLIFATIATGVVTGVGYALQIKRHGASGGTYCISSLVKHWHPAANIAWLTFVLDSVVVILILFVYDSANKIESAICTLLNLFIANIVVDYCLQGAKEGYKFEIITDKPEEISQELMENLHHGVTEIKVVGMYSHTDKYMIVCIIRKKQIGDMMKIIKKYKGTFASFSKVNEVFGRFRK